MHYQRTRRIFSLIASLWVGSFITIGFLVVPVLFSNLGDRQVAGLIAATLFKTTAYIGVLISVILMVMANHLVRFGNHQYRIVRWLLLGMLACAVGSAFILIPWMNALRDQALYVGLSVRESSHASLFARLHGTSSALFAIQALLGIALAWLTTKNAD